MLFDESPIVVDKTLARIIGLNEAIILQQIHYWLKTNKDNKKNFYDGKYWTYNSIKNWHEQVFDFWSYDTVKRTFMKLEDKGLLISGNFNKDRRDQTKWYTIDYDRLNSIYEEYMSAQCIGAKCTNGMGQNAPMQEGKLHQPLPEITTEITTKNNNNRQNGDVVEDPSNDDTRLEDLFFQVTGRRNDRFVLMLRDRFNPEDIKNKLHFFSEYIKTHEVKSPEGFIFDSLRRDYEPNAPVVKKVRVKCRKCEGYGYIVEPKTGDISICPICKGTGRIENESQDLKKAEA